MSIHPTAQVHEAADLGQNVQVGPYALIESGATVGDGCIVGSFCVIRQGVDLEAGVVLDSGVVLGGEPQDLKFRGEASKLRIGAGSRLREYVTVNRGTAATGETVLGRNCLIMAYVHVAHDCRIGDGAIVANAVQMGGHVRIGKSAVVSGMTGIHQFVSVGAGAFIGGGLRVDKDVPPGIKALGNPLRWGGLNSSGWERLGYPRDWLPRFDRFYRRLRLHGAENWLSAWEECFANPDDARLAKTALLRDLFADYFAHNRRGLLVRGEKEGFTSAGDGDSILLR